jgi:alkanesulfonate monooxygenase SsuD/methylene tetrahydromethanopterin reductase-like flavin-dependent oxidoreductase (luciferase family)
MKFGVFDHMDRAAVPLGEQYESRLRLIEAYEQAGFHAYHLAEHHQTPLGMASSPSLFLAAVAQRTRRLRFGPLVYTLSLYHPLRLLDEICMLDEMSGGRLELGVGRGISPIEVGFFGVPAAEAQAIYAEALTVILQGLAEGRVDHAGRHYTFRDVPVVLRPVQRPHPPLWYGVAKPEGTVWAAQNGVNIVCNGSAATVRAVTDRYRAEWRAQGRDAAALPLLGMSRHVVVAPSDGAALEIARRAYRPWYDHLMLLWRQHGMKPFNLTYGEDFDSLQASGQGVAGSPATVRERLAAEIEASGINYFVARLTFGDMTLAESMCSLELFARDVVPALAAIR